MSEDKTQAREGLTAGLFCYTVWGLLPLLFQAAGRAGAAPFEVVGWRTVWAVPFALGLVLFTRRWGVLRAILASPRNLSVLLLSSAFIGTNWSVYVWAVNTGHTLSGSLGYYINPILNMAAGAWLFGERMDRIGWCAFALAAAGVVLQGVAVGAFPWVSLLLAVSFCCYGVVRKRAVADAQTGLLVECVILSVPAAAYLAWLAARGAAHFGTGADVSLWLALGGPITVAPLFAFALAARKLPLTVMGFLQFIAPTLQFAIGVHNGEALNGLRIASFGFIWAGVAVFALGAIRRSRLPVQTEA